VTLTIAGEGESRGFLEELVQNLKLKKIVKFAGSVSEKTKVELLAKSWALVQPSRVEGWGITIIEANAAGTCVIASDVAGLRDSVKNPHTGLLVTWDNQEKWVDAICKVLKDEEFRGFLELNLNGWVKNFTWDKSSKKLIKLLRN
jgi:glycosyltransferase involved in cell wall biosynthesis